MDTAAEKREERGNRRGDPERTCIVTREAGSSGELIRFVEAPDGSMIPDLAGRLPGRGVWVTATRDAVEKAVATKAFSRALRKPISVGPALPAQVEDLLGKRVLDALSLANKAGAVTCGYMRVEAALLSGKTQAMLHAVDASDDGIDKLDRLYRAFCRETGRVEEVLRFLSVEQISLALGRSNVVHAALSKGGATQRFVGEAKRLLRYRHGPSAELTNDVPAPEGAGEGSSTGKV